MSEPAGHDGDLSYHQRMVADVHRMTTYERALRALVKPGDAVLDVGAGSGVLSIMAARAGARVVHAVESMAIGNLIESLAIHNGVADRLVVHQADIRELPVATPVDVIVSDCLGRFLLDDRMAEAMQAGFRWLRPGGVIIPAEVDLMLAPVELLHLPLVDTWRFPTLGLDLSPLEHFAEHQTYAVAVEPNQLLAAGQHLTTWTPPEVAPTFDKSLDFVVSRAGRLRGLVGWFRARLAPGVTLTTEPGYETHWSQLLFPLPPRAVAEGDRLTVRVTPRAGIPGREGVDGEAGGEASGWSWSVVLTRAAAAEPETIARADGGMPVETMKTRWPPFVDVAAEHARAEAAWAAGEHRAAAEGFARVLQAMSPRDPEAPDVWENLGIAWHTLGDFTAAIGPLMRALDGDWTSREQALRLLADSCLRSGHTSDGARWLALYEAHFGPHPAGWGRGG